MEIIGTICVDIATAEENKVQAMSYLIYSKSGVRRGNYIKGLE